MESFGYHSFNFFGGGFMQKMDLKLENLEMFIGTQNYYKFHFGTVITDGVKYVCDNGYYWFVSDAVIALKQKYLDKQSDFLVIQLKLKDGEADLIIEDGNGNKLYSQHYLYTDAERELKLYFVNDVVMLPSEY